MALGEFAKKLVATMARVYRSVAWLAGGRFQYVSGFSFPASFLSQPGAQKVYGSVSNFGQTFSNSESIIQ